MTYGPDDRVPELGLDQPDDGPGCGHDGIESARQCGQCKKPTDYWCAACMDWIESDPGCLCLACDVCGDPTFQCPGHPDIEALIESVEP